MPVSSQVRQIVPYKVDQTHLSLQDYNTVELDSLTVSNKVDLFKLSEQKVLPYETNDNTWVSVTVEMNLDRMEYSRSRYTALDVLSDIGGLQGMIAQLFAIFLAAWNFNAVDNFMVTKLFRVKPHPSNVIPGD